MTANALNSVSCATLQNYEVISMNEKGDLIIRSRSQGRSNSILLSPDTSYTLLEQCRFSSNTTDFISREISFLWNYQSNVQPLCAEDKKNEDKKNPEVTFQESKIIDSTGYSERAILEPRRSKTCFTTSVDWFDDHGEKINPSYVAIYTYHNIIFKDGKPYYFNLDRQIQAAQVSLSSENPRFDYKGKATFQADLQGKVFLPRLGLSQVIAAQDKSGNPLPLYVTEAGDFFVTTNLKSTLEIEWKMVKEDSRRKVPSFISTETIDWQKINPLIQNLINNIKTTSSPSNIFALRDFITQHSDFDFWSFSEKRDPTQIAEDLMKQSSCVGHNYLGADLLTQAGVPIRLVEGTFHGIPHLWVEAYLSSLNRWVVIDFASFPQEQRGGENHEVADLLSPQQRGTTAVVRQPIVEGDQPAQVSAAYFQPSVELSNGEKIGAKIASYVLLPLVGGWGAGAGGAALGTLIFPGWGSVIGYGMGQCIGGGVGNMAAQKIDQRLDPSRRLSYGQAAASCALQAVTGGASAFSKGVEVGKIVVTGWWGEGVTWLGRLISGSDSVSRSREVIQQAVASGALGVVYRGTESTIEWGRGDWASSQALHYTFDPASIVLDGVLGVAAGQGIHIAKINVFQMNGFFTSASKQWVGTGSIVFNKVKESEKEKLEKFIRDWSLKELNLWFKKNNIIGELKWVEGELFPNEPTAWLLNFNGKEIGSVHTDCGHWNTRINIHPSEEMVGMVGNNISKPNLADHIRDYLFSRL